MFSKEQIAQAKLGTHSIQFQPQLENCPKDVVVVSKVRGEHVWVRLVDGSEARLNKTASKLLVEGAYRAVQPLTGGA